MASRATAMMSWSESDGMRPPFRLDDPLDRATRGAVRHQFMILLGDAPAGDFEQHFLDDEIVRRDLAGHHRFAEPEGRVDDDLGAVAIDRIERHGHARRGRVDHLLHRNRHEQRRRGRDIRLAR